MDYPCGTVWDNSKEAARILEKYCEKAGIFRDDPNIHFFMKVAPNGYYVQTFTVDEIKGLYPQEIVTIIFGRVSEHLCKRSGQLPISSVDA